MLMRVPVKKADSELTFESERMFGGNTEAASVFDGLYNQYPGFRYAVDYGLKQTVNDGHAANTTKGGANSVSVLEKARAKLNRAIAGLIQRGGGGRSSIADPVLRRAMAVVTKRWEKLSDAGRSAMIGKWRAADTEGDFEDAEDDEVADAILYKWAHSEDIWNAAKEWVALEAAKKTAETVTTAEIEALIPKS